MEANGKIDWQYLQNNANNILAEGLSKLSNSLYYDFDNKFPKNYGNYVISHNGTPLYIGEASDLDKRRKEHLKGSTFYKNYLKDGKELNLPLGLSMNEFKIQHLLTQLGRKDLEEFGIVNLPAPLNKFQVNKRKLFSPESSTRLWDSIQENAFGLLCQAEKTVFSKRPIPWSKVDVSHIPGVYIIFNSHNDLIYIGESTSLLERYTTHSTKTRFSAFRRHIAVDIFTFTLKTKSELGVQSTDKKRMFVNMQEDREITQYINECKVIINEINFGRLELEEYLIRNLRPLLNSKGNK
ncbi:MAG: GIY-YIG nuclease family protein [Syntrophomonas sp.]